MSRSSFIKRKRDGRFALSFPPHVAGLLDDLAGQLDEMLDSDRPELRRLFPTAYSDDPERDAGYQVFARSELVDRRRANIARLRSTIDASILSADELGVWLQVVNDVRLVVGTSLDVSEDDEWPDPDDPRAGGFELYHFLGAVLSELVDAMSLTLDD